VKPTILIIAPEIDAPASTWINNHAPNFLKHGHEIVATMSPTPELLRASAVVLLPNANHYFAIAGHSVKNVVFLDSGLDSRDFVPGGSSVQRTIGIFDELIVTVLAAARSERAAAEALREEASRMAAAPAVPPALPHVEVEGEPLTAEKAAEIEYESGRQTALAGNRLPDLATDAAKAGFKSVADETQEAPKDAPAEEKSEPGSQNVPETPAPAPRRRRTPEEIKAALAAQ